MSQDLGANRPSARDFDWQQVQHRLDRIRQALETQGLPPEEQQQRILAQRAQGLAQPVAVADQQPVITLVAFGLGREQYGLETQYLREVVALRELTPLPLVPAFVAGIFNLRGQIMPVVDLKQYLELAPTGLRDFYTVLVLRGPEMELGLLVDRLIGTQQTQLAALQRPAGASAAGGRLLKGVTPEGVALLDAEALLADPKLIVNDEL